MDMEALSRNLMTCKNSENVHVDEEENQIYKEKYRRLKKTLKNVVSKNEYLKGELKHEQRKLVVVEEDKHFMLERLLIHEQPPLSPSLSMNRLTPGQDLSDASDPEDRLSTGTSTPKRARLGVTSSHPGGVVFSSAFSKIKPLHPGRKGRRGGRGSGRAGIRSGFQEFLDSPAGGFGLDSEDSSSLAGMGSMVGYMAQEEDSD